MSKRDVFILLGLVLLTTGMWMLKPFLAPTIAGVIIIYFGLKITDVNK